MNESPETDALRKDLEQLREDLALLNGVVRDNSRNRVQAGVDKARDCFDNLNGEMRARPFTGMVAAFGVGLLAGKLLSR